MIAREFNQRYYLEQLDSYHKLFYAVFELGQPIHSKSIGTAAVGFNPATGHINFLLNPDFFYNLGEKEQLFIICHEALHIVFSHLHRTYEFKLDPELANIAQDIVINELLVNEFGFERSLLDFGFSLCFINTIFTEDQINDHHIIHGKSFEFYYDLLVQKKEELKQGATVLDFHLDDDGQMSLMDEDGNIITAIPEEIADMISKKIGHQMSKQELEELLEDLKQTYGKNSQSSAFNVALEEKKKRPWEAIIKNKIASLQKTINKNNESFKFRPRRIVNLPEDLYLPESRDEDIKENDKFNIVFFIDSSGSCSSYQTKFFNLVRSVPESKFNVLLYSFDTDTYRLDIKKPSLMGGGGTEFEPLEETIQELIKTEKTFKKKHPDLVFILSDGDGSEVSPERPDRWYWLLTQNSTGNIPVGSNIIMLKDFTKNEPKVIIKK